jgi:hypothetical protein
MQYVITDGKLYISSKSGIHTIQNIKDATKFELDKAHNVLTSIPKSLKRLGWKVEPYVEEDAIKVNKQIDKSIEQFKGLTDNILEKMMDVETYVTNLKKYLGILDAELERVQLEIIDIEHAAEFFDLDMYKGWKLYKMLQEARKRRRKYKDEKAKIVYILGSNFVDCTNSAITNYIKSLDDRQYSPRVLQELFN